MHFKTINSLYKLIFFLPFLFIFGCGIWGDFTTYFNLYYDTSDIFGQAEDAINSQKQDLFSTEEIPIPGSATQLLNKVIQKASQILQFHSESAYVDNALLMLGKSFYYEKNYLKALRKFQELIATRPSSNLILETRLWIGKAEMKLKKYPDALKDLEDVKKIGLDQNDKDLVTGAYIEEIKYKLLQEDYAGAISSAKELLNVSTDDEINADVVYEMGKLYNLLNDPQNAIAEFEQVFNFSPSYDTEFDARLELGKAYREAGQPEKALNIFTNMRYTKNYSDAYDQIDLEIGKTEVDLKNYTSALDYFRNVDTGYVNSKSTGLAKYELGQLYQYHFLNYDSASYFYSKALTSQLPQDYILKANEKIQKFRKYKTLKDDIAQNEKKLEYVLNPDVFERDSIAFFSDTAKTGSEPGAGSNNPQDRFTRGRGNERRLSEVVQTPKVQNNTSNAPKIPPIRPIISADSIKSLLVQNFFELGNLFFTEFNLPDSAYFYYNVVLQDYPQSDYKARTLYALGSYYETKDDSLTADSLYEIIYNNYKGDRIVNAAASKLNKPLLDLNYDPAEELYANAEKKFNAKDFQGSIHEFYNIYKNYPKSALAPKALYATGWILENQLDKPDSAALFYDTVTIKYPASVYAAKISPEVSYYNSEQERIKKAYEDSLKIVEKARADSLKADSLRTLKHLSSGVVPSDTSKVIKSLPADTAGTFHKNGVRNPVSPNGIKNSNTAIDTTELKRGNRREINTRGVDSLQKNLGKTLDSLKAGRRNLEK
jgi:TolA-binding protein